MYIVKVVVVIALIFALHFLLWGKIYKTWLAKFKGIKKIFLLAACIFAELVLTILFGLYLFQY